LAATTMGTTSSSPYDIGEEVNTKLKKKNWHWTMHRGNKRGETGPGAHVSIFRANWSTIGQKAALAKHAFAKTRTLRHPKLLHFHDGTDGETECMVVTEEVTPFVDWIVEQSKLSDEQLFSLLSCGLKNILEALDFMHAQKFVHGLVCPESIFVTKSGEFKLWGLDCASNLSGADFGHFQTSERFLDELAGSQYRSPERINNDWDNLSKNFALIDVWSIGQMIPRMFDHMSPELTNLQKRMLTQNSFSRATIKQILNDDFLKSNPVVASMTFMDELQLKSHREIVMFFKSFPKIMKKIPNSILIHKVMPAITSGVGEPRYCTFSLLHLLILLFSFST
jgi:SCY1-like protein 1